MKRKTLFLVICKLFFVLTVASQVGIGTTTPNSNAALDIKATDKGVLFPRLTTAQRNAIANPPNGLHIYNTDENCMNFYDSVFAAWTCYCEMDSCKVVFIRIASNATNLNFYSAYAVNYPWARKFVILVADGVTVTGIDFTGLPTATLSSYQIKITNRGKIMGQGGVGGNGASGQAGSCSIAAKPGNAGGNAISTLIGLKITVDNFGLVAGGGGGGGGGGSAALGQYGGGGGGGAGGTGGAGAVGGGNTTSIFSNCVLNSSIAQNGINGTATTFGAGGTGASSGGNGGNGGGYAQNGQNGTGTNPGTGGAAGKAIATLPSGPSNSVINNINGGQSFGIVE